MTEATERFFESLPARAPAVLRGPLSGIIQFELSAGDRTDNWWVEMKPGWARATRDAGPADATWYSSVDLFDRLTVGAAQGVSAMLRNEGRFTGSVVLFLSFRRFFPDRPGTRDPRDVAREQAGRPG
ncbi:SCP2 sterol-binding domain-containing protein [Micromonospora sp. RTGN7]|uniref:SCP2 sterol-binding domain-containing protein n=1 Tax=Micromonospora sp. RTGN7 TaxID=3016526 RepID=UPI0029FED2A7|nr:SCP2 sterol-binding domain-containing protein [Micromonospora sp. RTGN7]